MEVLGYIMLLVGLAGWITHFIFIVHAIANKGIIELNFNEYKEMYPELIIIIIVVILFIIALIINWS